MVVNAKRLGPPSLALRLNWPFASNHCSWNRTSVDTMMDLMETFQVNSFEAMFKPASKRVASWTYQADKLPTW